MRSRAVPNPRQVDRERPGSARPAKQPRGQQHRCHLKAARNRSTRPCRCLPNFKHGKRTTFRSRPERKIGLTRETLMTEFDPPKAENPTRFPLCVQPEQPDALRLSDRTVATPSLTVGFGRTGSVSPKRCHDLGRSTSKGILCGGICRNRSDWRPSLNRKAQRTTPWEFIMAVRLLLLIACTGLFASAWNSDRSAEATHRLSAEVRNLPDRPSAADTVHNSLAVAQVGRTVSVSSEFDVSVVLLPELISPGTYRVVDAQGRVAWMNIPIDNNPERSATEPQPIYSSESAVGRWYFVRVESAPLIASPPATNAVRR